jgi:heat shock protein HtpX
MDVGENTNKAKLPGSGFGIRMGLLVGTNIAIIALFTIVAGLFGVDTNSIAGLAVFSALFGFGGAFISLAASKWIAKRSTGAQVIETPQNATETWLMDTVRRLSLGAGIEMPEVAIYPSNDVNAFATGAKRNDALVAVSSGLLQQMQPDEVEAVLAHEISHVANGDMVTLTLIQGVINTFVILVSRIVAQIVTETLMKGRGGRGVYFMVVIVLQIVLGFFASMIVMWFSRRRVFRADAGSGALAGNQKMIQALEALRRDAPGEPLPDQVNAMGIRPSGKGGLKKLLMSHPPIEDRIAALRP